MKIGIMLRTWGERGGIGVYTPNVLNALFRADPNNEYILIYRTEEHVKVFSNFKNVTATVVRAPTKLWWDQISIPRMVKEYRLDLIYNPKLSIPIFAKCKKVLIMRAAEQFVVPHAFPWWDRLYFTVANRLYCRMADAVISSTHLGGKDIVNFMGADPKKVHVIHESYNEHCRVLPPDEIEKFNRQHDLPRQFILFVGGLTPLKNFGNLLRAYKQVQKNHPHKLVVVGFNRFKYSKDLELVKKLGLEKDIIFLGFIPDEEIPAIYNMADLFLFPSLYEGFGLPILEAMACGCPVITSKTGCAPEVAAGGAVLVDPYNPCDIAEAINQVLTNQDLSRKLVEKGLTRFLDFSWEKYARELLGVFELLVKKKPVLQGNEQKKSAVLL